MPILSQPWGDLAFDDLPGKDIPLVFLHGAGRDRCDWDPVLAHLIPGPRSITLDFRGHGRSATPPAPYSISDLADDVLALADHLRLDRFVLVGHSLGGMVALELAARSRRAAALLLLEGWTRLLCYRAFAEGHRFGRLDPVTIRELQLRLQATRDRHPPGLWDEVWKTVEAFDAADYLASADIPILEAYGDLGRTVDTQRLLAVPDNPHIQWVWLPGAGHYLPTERPQDVADLCRRAVNPSSADT